MFKNWFSGGIKSPCFVVFEFLWNEYFNHSEFQATDINWLQTSWKCGNQCSQCFQWVPAWHCLYPPVWPSLKLRLKTFPSPRSSLVPPGCPSPSPSSANYGSDFYQHRLDFCILELHQNIANVYVCVCIFFGGGAIWAFFPLRFEMYPDCCVCLVVCPFSCPVVLHCMERLQSVFLVDIWVVASIGFFWGVLKVGGFSILDQDFSGGEKGWSRSFIFYCS